MWDTLSLTLQNYQKKKKKGKILRNIAQEKLWRPMLRWSGAQRGRDSRAKAQQMRNSGSSPILTLEEPGSAVQMTPRVSPTKI